MNFKLKLIPLSIMIALSLTACVTPHEVDPQITYQNKFNGQTQLATSFNPNWWHIYHDERLNQFIDTVLKNNDDLSLATLKVKKAQLNVGLSKTDLLPTSTFTVNPSISKDLKHGYSSKSQAMNYQLSYEVDLWGKLSDTVSANEWETKATIQDRENTKLTLIGTAISLYYKMMYLNEAIQNTKDSIHYYEQLLNITQAQYKVGVASELDLAQSKEALANEKAVLPQLNESKSETQTSINLLLNQAPETATNFNIQDNLPNLEFNNIQANLPTEVLGNRPDVIAAQMRVKEAFIQAKVTEKGYYPTLNITGTLGTSSDDLSRLISNPLGTLGASLALPFLNFNQNRLNVKLSQNEYEQLVITYRKTLYTALQDMENTLSNYYNQKERVDNLKEAYLNSEKVSKLYELKYKVGETDMKTLLDTEQEQRQIQLTLIQEKYNLINYQSQVYQAMGGMYE
jgi:NodT family efflux transporter outer membrane factor (OMF) lipoprotein